VRRIADVLIRRRYNSPGSNHYWHIGGYDKLKYYGLPIHGNAKSNKDQLVPAYYFLEILDIALDY